MIIFILLLILMGCKIRTATEPTPIITSKSGAILMTYDGFQSNKDRWGDTYWLPSRMSRMEKDSVDTLVRGFFSLWDIDVTEDESVFYTYPTEKRARCVITLTPMSEAGQIGMSYPFTLETGDTTSAVINPSIVKFDIYCIAASTAHEVGHMLGLLHHLKIKDDYDMVYVDTGNIIKAPIMGWPPIVFKNRVWGLGIIYSRDGLVVQDDTAIISKTWRRIK